MTHRSILAIDVGNSRIKAGLFDTAPSDVPLPDCRLATAISVHDPTPAPSIGQWLSATKASAATVLLGGVNPAVIATIRDEWRREWGELTLIERPSPSILVNRTELPERVGPDRLFDAVAANRLRPKDTAAVVVDSGTATTVNLVDQDGAFCGGAILAGFELVASALHERTALLPKIDAAKLADPPEPLGRNTETAMRSGLYWGLVGGVKEIVGRFSRTAATASQREPLVVLTGGASPLLAPHLPSARIEPYLTLQGMVLSATTEPRP